MHNPGRLQQAIIAALASNPAGVLTSKSVIALCYPGAAHLEKHRVAATRALRKLAEDVRFESFAGTPAVGGRIIAAATDARSLGIARVFGHYAGTKTIEDCACIVDDASTEAHREVQDGGLFALIAERNRLWAAWRDDEADALTARIDERIAQVKVEA